MAGKNKTQYAHFDQLKGFQEEEKVYQNYEKVDQTNGLFQKGMPTLTCLNGVLGLPFAMHSKTKKRIHILTS